MKIKVLLVDDEEEYTELLSKRLETRNCDVSTAFDGDDAIKKVQQGSFDVIIMDVMMPGKSGIEAFKEIKKVNPLIHVIMLTGHAELNTAIEGMRTGAYDYLIKPVQIEELVELIEMAHKHKMVSEQKYEK